MTNNTNKCPTHPRIGGTVYTVIVFGGAPSSNALTEHNRVHFDNVADARRYARRVTTEARTNWQTGGTYVMPCASIFEDSPTRGLGKHVAEYASRARAAYLKKIARNAEGMIRAELLSRGLDANGSL